MFLDSTMEGTKQVAQRSVNAADHFVGVVQEITGCYRETWKARDAAGFTVHHPEACPLLGAEVLVVEAENALFDACAEDSQYGDVCDAATLDCKAL